MPAFFSWGECEWGIFALLFKTTPKQLRVARPASRRLHETYELKEREREKERAADEVLLS
jgi:hypothetical protein